MRIATQIVMRRARLAVGVAGAGLLAAVAVFARHGMDSAVSGSATPLLTRVQTAVVQPVTRAVGREIERRLRSRREARQRMSGIGDEEAIARFLDERTSLADRRVYAYRLAAIGTPDAIAALRRVLATAPPEDRAFVVQLIGTTDSRAMKPELRRFLDDPDTDVARAAVRALAAIGGADVAAELGHLMGADDMTDAMRIEAAIGLGEMGTAAARRALLDALAACTSGPVASQIVESLGRFPFARVAGAFGDLLTRPSTPAELRVTAVEALSRSTRDAVPFLLDVAAADADEDVRAAAAWASGMQGSTQIGPRLAALAVSEPAADVRRRLYEALLPQREIPIERLLPAIDGEDDLAAKVAGLNAIGAAVGRDQSAPIAAAFDAEIVPDLRRIADSENSLNLRMRAVFALRRAGTPAAQEALVALATDAGVPPAVRNAARHGVAPDS